MDGVPDGLAARGPALRQGLTVLLVDEDESWRTRAAAALYRAGYDVMSQSDRWRIAEMLDEAAPELVLLCADFPEQDARFARLLAQWPPPPRLVLLCPHDRVGERAASLSAGADECLPKPADPSGLCGLLEGLPPSLASPTRRGETLEFDGWRLDPRSARLVAPGGRATGLVPGDSRLLRAFIDHRGRILSRRRLHELCGVDERVGEQAMDCRVSRLRTTLRELQPGCDMIRTVRGEGYVFVGSGPPGRRP